MELMKLLLGQGKEIILVLELRRTEKGKKREKKRWNDLLEILEEEERGKWVQNFGTGLEGGVLELIKGREKEKEVEQVPIITKCGRIRQYRILPLDLKIAY